MVIFMNNNLLIIGAGGFGKNFYEIAMQSQKFDNIKFLDDNVTNDYVIGKCTQIENFIKDFTYVYPAFGDNVLRLKWVDKLKALGYKVPCVIHNSAYVSDSAKLEDGTVILQNAIVNANVKIGKGVLINCGVIVDHDAVIEDGVHLCLGSIIKANITIEKCRKIEAGKIIEGNK